MVAWDFPAAASPITGAPGTVAGVTLFEAAEAGPAPSAFTALTVNVYAVPRVSPPTGIVLHGASHVPIAPPGEAVALNDVMGDPPSLAGGVKVTTARLPTGLAVPMPGAPGTLAGVTLFDAADGSPVPAALVAVTVNV